MDAAAAGSNSWENVDEPTSSSSPIVRSTVEDKETNLRRHSDSESSQDFELHETGSDGGSHASFDPQGSPISSTLKRPADDADDLSRPFKRKRSKGAINNEYLDLLNQDIEDAAAFEGFGRESRLQSTQMGLVRWSTEEKEVLFQAVTRLGRYDLPGIASHIRTKSEIEVHHFLKALDRATNKRRKTPHLRPALVMVDYPAAVEFTQRCCHAQEELADDLSLRIERREQLREERLWGSIWNITPAIAMTLEKEVMSSSPTTHEHNADEPTHGFTTGAGQASQAETEIGGSIRRTDRLPFTSLFDLSEWLMMSRRVFMNSSLPGNNWHAVEDAPPSIWATAFEDFHSLTISLTRRVIQATLFVAMSRIRDQTRPDFDPVKSVRAQDVVTAVQSLGLPLNSEQYWRGSARRLRLNVYEEPPGREQTEVEDPMSYSEFEDLLDEHHHPGLETSSRDLRENFEATKHEDEEEMMEPDQYPYNKEGDYNDSEHIDDSDDSDDDDDDDKVADESDDDHILASFDNCALDEDYLRTDSLEILRHTAAEFPETKRAKDALFSRIAIEREQDGQAEEFDLRKSRQEEAEMWKILAIRPPVDIVQTSDLKAPAQSNRNVDGILPMHNHWTQETQYYAEWETKLD